jgi:hypothetical protein
MNVSQRTFLKECIKKMLIKHKWTINNLHTNIYGQLLASCLEGTIQWTFLPSLAPIDPVVSEKKIKMQKLTDDYAVDRC